MKNCGLIQEFIFPNEISLFSQYFRLMRYLSGTILSKAFLIMVENGSNGPKCGLIFLSYMVLFSSIQMKTIIQMKNVEYFVNQLFSIGES